MKLDIQKFATGGVIMNIVKEYTYEQELKETVKIIATPDNSETEFDFQNDFTCSIDDEGWTSTGENGSYYKIFNTKEKKTITFTYLNNDNPNYKIIGDIDIDTTDLHKFYNLTICVDKQPMTNPSSDLKKYNIKLLSPLRSYLDAFDQFVMSDDGKYKVIRNIEKYNGSLRKLKTPIEETVGKLEITLFEGTNYFYIENTGKYLMNVQYLTNSKLNKTYATKMELNSKLEQTVEGFTLTVSKKVDNDEIISTINQSAEQVKINADKISLEGKTIDLTGDNVIIKSKNFNVDKEGNLEAKNGKFIGGEIKLGSSKTNPKMLVTLDLENPYNVYGRLHGYGIHYEDNETNSGYNTSIDINSIGAHKSGEDIHVPAIQLDVRGGSNRMYSGLMTPYSLAVAEYNYDSISSSTVVSTTGIITPSVTQTSLESIKKNFEKFNDGLSIIKNSDIYKYHLKTQNDKDKKHIGLVIGDKYKTPDEIIQGEGIDLYAMISIAWQSIKEQQEKITQLEERVSKLEGEVNE